MSDVEEIKQRLDIVDVVRDYMQLKQAGANWKGLCPFHNEKNPSFMVSGEKQIWHCFGCSEGGDIFTFVQKIEGIEFPEALRLLAERAGVKINKVNPQVKNEKTVLMDVCELAARFFNKVLLQTDPGKKAHRYLQERKVSEKMIEDFLLGYAPNSWQVLGDFLRKKGFSEKEIFAAGLSAERKRGGGYYDRFRGRVMFPIADVYGNIVGFTGRILEDQEGVGKYINTPQTLIYDKSRVIYGLHKAKQAIKEKDLAVLVEGNMDVVASHQAGIKNVVAVSGTALTIDQLKLIKRYTHNLALAFDADPAGQGACERSIDLALQEEINVKIIEIPKGKDPDDCIKSKENGVEIWQQSIDKAKTVMQYYFDKVSAQYDLNKVEDKKKAAHILLHNISKITNKIEQTHWLQKLSELLKISESVLRDSLPRRQKGDNFSPVKEVKNLSVESKTDRQQALASRLLAVIFKFSAFFPLIVEKIIPEMFDNPQHQQLYKEIVNHYNKVKEIDPEFLLQELSEQLALEAQKMILLADNEFNDDFKEKELKTLIENFIREFNKKKREELINAIKQAEKSGDNEKLEFLLKDLQKFVE